MFCRSHRRQHARYCKHFVYSPSRARINCQILTTDRPESPKARYNPAALRFRTETHSRQLPSTDLHSQGVCLPSDPVRPLAWLRKKIQNRGNSMKLRLLSAGSLVSVLVLASAVMAVGQMSQPLYAPHKPGTPQPRIMAASSEVQPVVSASSAFWTKIKTLPSVSVGSMLLLTDGRVLVHSEPNCSGCTGNYQSWYTLTPDNTGSYINGTWTQVASLPGSYAPLFFGSAVLPDGKVVITGGEYNCKPSCSGIWQSLGALYDPVLNTWTATTAPANSNIGDAQSVVLPNGTWMLAECCAIAFGRTHFPGLLQLQRKHAGLHRSGQLHRWQER